MLSGKLEFVWSYFTFGCSFAFALHCIKSNHQGNWRTFVQTYSIWGSVAAGEWEGMHRVVVWLTKPNGKYVKMEKAALPNRQDEMELKLFAINGQKRARTMAWTTHTHTTWNKTKSFQMCNFKQARNSIADIVFKWKSKPIKQSHRLVFFCTVATIFRYFLLYFIFFLCCYCGSGSSNCRCGYISIL